jgi:hypothetical protein
MKLFHTSPVKIETINNYGMLGECLCFSSDVYQMAPGEVITYAIEIDESEMIEASSFFYQDDAEKLDVIVSNIMAMADCDSDQAEKYLSQNDNHHDAEIAWRIQGYAGEAAKVLGYQAAVADDEQGTVYIIPMSGREAELCQE